MWHACVSERGRKSQKEELIELVGVKIKKYLWKICKKQKKKDIERKKEKVRNK